MTERHTNRLSTETSPYLLQHAHNPVNWYPWGEEAISLARGESKPILLSIGYAACHWCHVMERESFENEAIAELMNEHFVCIKVDREERPDVDEIYMNAVQMITGSGGWPLTVFLTPELRPFFGGTYFPPDDRYGRPGFGSVLKEISRVFREEPDRVEGSAGTLTEQIQSMASIPESSEMLSRSVIGAACRELGARFDQNFGGFGQAPKFPPSTQLSLLMLHYFDTRDADALKMVDSTLQHMGAGGMYDHLGGGFHRYSTDARWLAPHFEKMLYDNALLVRTYLEAYQLTGNDDYARTARECLDWVIREMQDEAGGYYSTLDADSEGVEGKFYVWSESEVQDVLGDDAQLFCASYDVTSGGNWESTNILNTPRPLERVAEEQGVSLEELNTSLASSRKRLLELRGKRIWPALDDKVLTSWNGLMVVAMARGARTLGDDRYYQSAVRAARFILETLRDDNGRLLATYRAGEAKLKAYLDDHAFLLAGLVELYETDFDVSWLEHASELASAIETLFWDGEGGSYFTGTDHEELIARTRSGYDGAIPSGNAVASLYLLRLWRLTGDEGAARLAQATIRAFQAQFESSPSGFSALLTALDFYLGDTSELAIVSESGSEATVAALAELGQHYAPRTVFALFDPDKHGGESLSLPVLEGKTAGVDPSLPQFYFCRNFSCQAPTGDIKEVVSQLEATSDHR